MVNLDHLDNKWRNALSRLVREESYQRLKVIEYSGLGSIDCDDLRERAGAAEAQARDQVRLITEFVADLKALRQCI